MKHSALKFSYADLAAMNNHTRTLATDLIVQFSFTIYNYECDRPTRICRHTHTHTHTPAHAHLHTHTCTRTPAHAHLLPHTCTRTPAHALLHAHTAYLHIQMRLATRTCIIPQSSCTSRGYTHVYSCTIYTHAHAQVKMISPIILVSMCRHTFVAWPAQDNSK